MGKFLEDFKAFAMKGNVVDMAVGVIVGGAFGKIVSSLVNDVITPAQAAVEGVSPEVAEVAVNYGMFIQNIVDFLIIALSIFVALRVILKFKKREEEAPAAPPEPTKEEVLLTEIRDLLRDKNN